MAAGCAEREAGFTFVGECETSFTLAGERAVAGERVVEEGGQR